MKKILLMAAAVALFGDAAMAEGHVTAETAVALKDVQWEDVAPGFQMALTWRDENGREAWLFRMKAGGGVPMHAHTNSYWGTIIQGTWVHIEADGTEVVTGPGGYAMVRGGDVHADRCEGEVTCVGLLNYLGPRDILLPN